MRSASKIWSVFGLLALVCVHLTLAAAPGNTGEWADGIVSIRLQPLANGEAKMDIQLKSGASLVLYYDNQLPRNTEVLETFWFRERSDARSDRHTFTLSEIEEGKIYYFRLASTWPAERRTATLQWTIPAKSTEVIVIK